VKNWNLATPFLPAGYSVLRCYGSCCIHKANKTSDSCLRTLNTNLASYRPCNGRPLPSTERREPRSLVPSAILQGCTVQTYVYCAYKCRQATHGLTYMEPECLLTCSQQSATASYSVTAKSVHTFTRYSFYITFNIILPSTPRSNECFLPVTTLDLSYI
jgi:hypothetical protein